MKLKLDFETLAQMLYRKTIVFNFITFILHQSVHHLIEKVCLNVVVVVVKL